MPSELIRGRPWVLLVLWIVIAGLAAPLAAKIDEVVKARQEEMLPETVESIRAENAMSELSSTGEGSREASMDYIIVVHGANVSLEFYKEFLEEYRAIEEEYNADLTSWIDIVSEVEAGIRENVSGGLDRMLEAVGYIVMASRMFNETREALNGTAELIAGADLAYASLYNASSALNASMPLVKGALKAMNSTCNSIASLLMAKYFNVIRTEALIEAFTDAYSKGYLSESDVENVLSHAYDFTQYGIEPVTRDLVLAVYNYTLSIGGPGNFSNERAALLARNLSIERVGLENVWLLDIAYYNWVSAVSAEDDHRYVYDLSSYIGQAMLLANLSSMVKGLKPGIAISVTNVLAERAPPEAFPILNATLWIFVEDYNLVVSNIDEAAYTVVERQLVAGGLDDAIASRLAGLIVSGNLSREAVAAIASEVAGEKVPPELAEKVSRVLEALPGILVKYDPGASGVLADKQTARYVASVLILEARGVSVNETLASELKSLTGDLEVLTVKVMEGIAGAMGQAGMPPGALEALYERGLLGVPISKLRAELPAYIAESAAAEMNVSVEQLEPIAEAAVRVYFNETTTDEEVARLVDDILSSVFDDIIEELKGMLVEKGLGGFIVSVTLPSSGDPVEVTKRIAGEIRSKLKDMGYDVEAYAGGDKILTAEMRESARRDIERSDRLSILFVIVILGAVMGGVVAVILPFTGIGLGLLSALAVAYVLGSAGVIDVTTHSRMIMFTTGLGLGIDYAGLISKRFREAMESGLGSREAAAEAFKRGWRPVLAGGVTASIGFGSMILASDFKFVTSLGTNVPIAILLVMATSLTFIPALLAYVGGSRLFWWPSRIITKSSGGGAMRRIGEAVTSKPILLLALVLVAGILGAAWFAGFEGSYDLLLNLPRDTDSAKAYSIINSYYDPGILYPVYIVASTADSAGRIAEAVKSSLADCVARAEVLPGYEGRVVKVTLDVYPLSAEAVKCAEAIRSAAHQADPESLVGGMPAVNLDLRNLVNDRFYNRVYPVAITLMFLTMLVAYGGVAVALSAVASVVLAALWGSAIAWYIATHIMGYDVLWFLPIVVFTAILGVGMDYNSFFIARAREECEKGGGKSAVVEAVAKGSSLVIGLAAIMAGAYVGIALASSPGLSAMGIALTIGVLLAGLNASVIITPSLIAVMGRRAWWPRPPRGGG